MSQGSGENVQKVCTEKPPATYTSAVESGLKVALPLAGKTEAQAEGIVKSYLSQQAGATKRGEDLQNYLFYLCQMSNNGGWSQDTTARLIELFIKNWGQEPGDSNERANRAWLTVKGQRAPFHAVVNGSAELEIIYENTGRSPAEHIVFSAMAAVQRPDWSPPDPVPTDPNQQQSIGVVGPGQRQILYFGRKRPFSAEEIDAINHGRTVLFYAGQVRYEDQFSKSRGLQFCLRYEPPKDEKPVNYMIPCSSYDKVW